MPYRCKHTTCNLTTKSVASLHFGVPTPLTPAVQRIGGRGPDSLRSFYPGHMGGSEEPLTLHSSGRALRLADFPSVTFLLYLRPPPLPTAPYVTTTVVQKKRSLSIEISIK